MYPEGISVGTIPGHQDHGPIFWHQIFHLPPVLAPHNGHVTSALVIRPQEAPVQELHFGGGWRRQVQEANVGSHTHWLDVHQKAAQSHWMCGLFVTSRIFHGATANVHICTWDEDALHTIALPTNAIFGFQVQRSPNGRDGSASQLRKGHQLRFLRNKWPILRRERIHMLWPHGFTGVCPLMHDCCDRLNGGIVKEEGRLTWHVVGIQTPQPGDDGNGYKGIEPRIHNIILGLDSHRCSHHIIIFIQRRNLLWIRYNL
mmetsp:Transcript_9393/g.19502  ORF Transcript_9393/g.19502 Transcript_9393/m.19502 type:complete len:258 (+) Transcript_9393:636-1409(+)